MEYSVVVKDNHFRVYLNGLIHVSLKQEDIVGFQSWVEGEETKRYIIELYTTHKTILVGYNEREKWSEVLKRIDNVDIYSHYKIE